MMTAVERAFFMYRVYCEMAWFEGIEEAIDEVWDEYGEVYGDLTEQELFEEQDLRFAFHESVGNISRYYGREARL